MSANNTAYLKWSSQLNYLRTVVCCFSSSKILKLNIKKWPLKQWRTFLLLFSANIICCLVGYNISICIDKCLYVSMSILSVFVSVISKNTNKIYCPDCGANKPTNLNNKS